MAARVKVAFCLGSEMHSASANEGKLSEKLASVKTASMEILKEYITKHNVPNDVPDEPLDEVSSEEEDEVPGKSQVQSKKTKIN